MGEFPYLAGYGAELQEQAGDLLKSGKLLQHIEQHYGEKHQIHSSKDLGAYVQGLKSRFMRNAAPLGRVQFDDRLHAVHNALGLHTTRTQQHGSKVRMRREIRVAALFKQAAPEFLRMIVVHELAHMKHANHDQAFYSLCTYMEPEYHRYELDLRLWLTAVEWGSESGP